MFCIHIINKPFDMIPRSMHYKDVINVPFAEFSLNSIEWLHSCHTEFNPKLYKRYVYDIFVMIRSRDHIQMFVDYMNTKHLNIRFTFEIEDQNIFTFLDIKIIRSPNKKTFKTSVYRKSTPSGVFTNFKSFIPMTYITGLLETMLFHSFSICSSYEKFHEEIVKLKEIFKGNSYPKFLPRRIYR